MLGPLGRSGELGAAENATAVTLLTGSMGAKAKRQALLDAQSGAAGIVVGTHALIQDTVGFAELGLVVVDEQHRFGVEQRDALRARGEGPAHAGHDGHADPAHRGHDRLRRPGRVRAEGAAEGPLPGRDDRRAAGGAPVVDRAGVAADPRGGRGGPPVLRRVPRVGGAEKEGAEKEDAEEPPPDDDGGEERRARSRCSTSPADLRSWPGCASGSCTASSRRRRRTP